MENKDFDVVNSTPPSNTVRTNKDSGRRTLIKGFGAASIISAAQPVWAAGACSVSGQLQQTLSGNLSFANRNSAEVCTTRLFGRHLLLSNEFRGIWDLIKVDLNENLVQMFPKQYPEFKTPPWMMPVKQALKQREWSTPTMLCANIMLWNELADIYTNCVNNGSFAEYLDCSYITETGFFVDTTYYVGSKVIDNPQNYYYLRYGDKLIRS